LQAYEYGEQFRYSEVMGFSKGFRGWKKAAMITTQLGGFIALMLQPWSRRFLQKKVLPKPGEGPSKKQRESGYFTVDLLAINDGFHLWVKVQDDLDPGYGSTAKMLAESAITLAIDSQNTPKQYGCVTPASALANPLIERLQKAGMKFTIPAEDLQK